MSSDLTVSMKKYGMPAIFTILSLVILVVGFTQDQEAPFIIAGVLMLLGAVLSILFSAGKLTKTIATIIAFVAGILAVVAIYLATAGIADTIISKDQYKRSKGLAIQNLTDIRDIQKMYFNKYNKYAGTWEEFEDFVKNGKIETVLQEGTVPNDKITPEERDYLYSDNRSINKNMTEEEAWRLSKWTEGPRYDMFIGFKRDTVETSLLESKFTKNKSYKATRSQNDYPEFTVAYIDSLKFVPFTKGKKQWKLEVKDSVDVGGVKVPAIKVSGLIPYPIDERTEKLEEIYFGDLTRNNVDASWEKK